jgi:hypothetical protein
MLEGAENGWTRTAQPRGSEGPSDADVVVGDLQTEANMRPGERP